MNKISLRPVLDNPALVVAIGKIKILCIADLHLGLELVYADRGVNLQPQTDIIIEKIISIIKREKISLLFILGDLKHNIPLNTVIEAIHIPEFLSTVNQLVDVTIIPGNHDTGLRKISPKNIKIARPSGLIIEEGGFSIGFIHGHSKPDADILKTDALISAHTHPAIKLVDRLYKTFIEPVWVKNELIISSLKTLYGEDGLSYRESNPKLIIMPAFNPLITGSPINTFRDKPFLGPIQKDPFIKVNESEIYLLDGTYLGRLRELPKIDQIYSSGKTQMKHVSNF